MAEPYLSPTDPEVRKTTEIGPRRGIWAELYPAVYRYDAPRDVGLGRFPHARRAGTEAEWLAVAGKVLHGLYDRSDKQWIRAAIIGLRGLKGRKFKQAHEALKSA